MLPARLGANKSPLAWADLDISDYVRDSLGSTQQLVIPLKDCATDISATIQVQVSVKFVNESIDEETKRLM